MGAITSKTTVMAKKLGDSFKSLQKDVKANQVAFAALSAGATYMFMKIASNSALSSAVMSQFMAVLSYFADMVMNTLLPAIQPLLDALWRFTEWYAGAPEPLKIVIAIITALGFAFTTLAFLVGPVGTAIKVAMAVGSVAISGIQYAWGLMSDVFQAVIKPALLSGLKTISNAIANNSGALVTLGAAMGAAFGIYMAFTSKSPAIKAAFSAMTGAMVALAAATWIEDAAAMLNVSVLTLGIGIAAVVAGATFGLSMLYGAKAKAGTAPAMAAGGIVMKPTMALIGEAGPEAVIPLGRGKGFGGGLTINFDLKGATIVDANKFQSIIKQSSDQIAIELYRRGVIARPI